MPQPSLPLVLVRRTATSRDVMAGCFVCHGVEAHWTSANAQALAAQHHDRTGHQTWCDIALSVRYGRAAPDDRQTDIEDAIASASSGDAPDDASLTDLDSATVAPAASSAPEGRPVETCARGRQPETVSS